MTDVTPTPLSAIDQQQLTVLQQIQHTLLINHQAFLVFLSSASIPVAWKLAIYHFISSLPLPQVSPWEITLLIIIAPPVFVLVLFAIIKIFLVCVQRVLPFILAIFLHTPQDRICLELTFPSDTGKSAYATQQLYLLLHTVARQKTFRTNLIRQKRTYSLEIVSSKEEGIRYIIVVPSKNREVITRSLMSYLPGMKIREIDDYLHIAFPQEKREAAPDESNKQPVKKINVIELSLASHHALPLHTQKMLAENDPVAYLTGHMTQLSADELIAFQIVTTPVLDAMHRRVITSMKRLRQKIYMRQPITPELSVTPWQRFTTLPGISLIWFFVNITFVSGKFAFLGIVSMLMAIIDPHNEGIPILQNPKAVSPQELLNPYEQELQTVVKEKIDQHLFESTIRILVVANTDAELEMRLSGIMSTFGQMSSPYQSLRSKSSFLPRNMTIKNSLMAFKNRVLAANTIRNPNPILSTSEMADLYHFPFTNTTKTEDMLKVVSPELPAPLVLKNAKQLAVVFARNTYGKNLPIGLSDDERSRHMYLIGQTGSGKSTILYNCAKDDIQKGRGLCVIDPHGDLVEDLLHVIPIERINDVVYIDPFAIKHPIRINLLELTPGLDEDEQELEKELVVESVISIFRRIFSKDENADAHRIEYILRNTIYTAFYVEGATIFTVYKILTNPEFRNKAIALVDNEHLQDFWKYEFGKAGDWQVFKMVSGVTAKVGRFLFSPIASRILEEPVSSIDFDELLNQGKIILCNLSEGKLGEDTAHLLGTTIITKIHQTILRRARMEKTLRNPFYLYVDEFQNFATSYFTKLLSGGRKYGLRVTIAEQSTTQQADNRIVNVILANVGTVICFRTASPVDEELLLPQFAPLVKKGDIINLPRHRFYIKLGAKNPQEPFSGETIAIDEEKQSEKVSRIITASRKNYATIYERNKKIDGHTEHLSKKKDADVPKDVRLLE